MALDRDIFGKEQLFARLQADFSKRSDPNGKAIHAYVKSKQLNVHPRRLVEYYLKLGLLDKLMDGKPFQDYDQDDLGELMVRLRKRQGRGGKLLGARSMNNYRLELRCILKFLKKDDLAKLVKDQKLDQLNDFTPEDMLTNPDMVKLLKAAPSARDRAIIALGGERGPRPSEYFNLQVKDIHAEATPKTIVIYGKGRKREVPILAAWPYIADCLDLHPKAKDPDAPLFLARNGRPLRYAAVKRMLERTFERAGVNKPAKLELFRHTVNTWCYTNLAHETAAYLCGHVPGSRAYRHYIHMNKRQVLNRCMVAYGMMPLEPIEAPMQPKKCMVCQLENRIDAELCARCKNPFSVRSAAQLLQPKQLMDRMVADPALGPAFEAKLFEVVDKMVEERLCNYRTNGDIGGTEI